MNKRPIGIDLFAGAGGMSLGFEQAGFDVVAAVEIDPVHCAVHEFNFPETAIIPKSVVGLSAVEIRERAGIGNRRVDCVFGGPPCQGFSLIGHRAFDDPRNALVMEFVRLVAELDARTFVFENVKGLTVGKHKKFLEELACEFESHGYEVNFKNKKGTVLNASNFDVPQHRERLILIGAKKGENLPHYPGAVTTAADGKKPIEGLPLGPTVEEAIGDLPDVDQFPSLLSGDTVNSVKFGALSSYGKKMRCLENNSWHFGYQRLWQPNKLTSSARTEHTEISRKRFAATEPGSVEPISRFYKLAANGLSNTLRAGTDGSRGAFTSPRPVHYKYPRCISVREMARLHGYPDWFRFHVTKWHGARQIGNSVPPPLARAVATAVIDALGVTPTQPDYAIELGRRSLLEMDLTAAAKKFGVPPIPSRRDRKSGAKKRKQEEIEETLIAKRTAYG
ncbi:DNA cytosine methyltransferase [Roseibium sediminicola]|uniref:Cytosine-specific methyltransferase n=1 Tax=Roseibium sediminicola TaxID=2933272 RepID=A0ABT0H1F7_9HYPH|nr:DNA cytosine methyltransferase [Roseibium sp. CAU 1639]MCK7615526.1 DNA cytosine methyltransferase [Roseibium sp. CAU 1639]